MAAAKRSSKKPAAAKKAGGKRSNRKPRRTWSVYIHRALRQVNKNLSLSSKAMAIVNSFCNDVFERVAEQAAQLTRIEKRRTLGSREIQTAVRLVLPAELGKHAIAEGSKSVAKLSA